MRLTSLEIKGFKSFGDKVTIHFDQGVTAIVGPNGSGKSNVVDAMRWVLGEQKTRLLRSEKMENIIFNGTRQRKPSNLAEVSLSFENNKGILPVEYAHVTITRRLYRSGESEYLLNGVTCRLKDINDLFLDTGIGPDSYAIIELNMVDDILKDRNNTINTLLEEAAGISKYKIRKRQTFQKLEETDNDLNRVNDLLFEIEKSLKQLESQAKKTDRYYRLREEYKTLSTQLALYSIRHHSGQLGILQQKENEQHDSRNRLNTELEALESALQDLKAKSYEKEQRFQSAQKASNEKLLEFTRFENEEKNRSEKLNFLVEKQQQLQLQSENDEKTSIGLRAQLADLETEKVRDEEQLKRLQENVLRLKDEAAQSRKDHDQSQVHIREINQQLYQLRNLINELETKQAVSATREKSIQEELARYRQQSAETQGNIVALENEIAQLLPAQEQADSRLKTGKQDRLQLNENLKLAESRMKELNQILQAESRKLDAKHNEYQLTKNLLEQMEGYPESIRYLKKNHDRSKQAPLLSEIIVCEDEYKVAIENFLDPYLNHFVVNTMEDAWDALESLNTAAKGRAHFFVLETLENFKPVHPKVMEGCTPALDVIEKNSKYNQLFSFLLGHVQVLEQDRSLQDYSIHDDQSLVIISQSGNFLRQRYVVGGGSVGRFDGKRTGKFRNLEKLGEELKQQEQLIDNYREQVNLAEQEVISLKEKSTSNQEDVAALEKEFMQVNSRLNSLQSNRDFYNNNLQQLLRNSSRLEEEAAALNRLMEENANLPDSSPAALREKLNRMMEELNVQQEHSSELQKQSVDKAQLFNQENIILLQHQNKIQNVSRDISYKSNQAAVLEKNKIQYAEELESVKTQMDTILGGMQTTGEALRALIADKAAAEQELREAEAAYAGTRTTIDEEERRIQEIRKNKELADAGLQQVHDELNELKLQMHSLKERLSIEFNIDINDLIGQEPDPEFNEEEMRPRAEQLRKRVSEFGPINPMALEQYKEIKERYDFIINEKTDLQNAKESLLKTISEIEETAKTVFMDAFTHVRANFIRVFRSLFTDDDNCDLILSDPSNPLECDIQIIAQPKGKKPLSIHQLSGGEKTLTATALLFGIYLLKPAPFCIFDEVDAPLDDNNIDKFNNIIKKFSSESQFIIITHNKRTMSATDIMYGITMAEQGVTTVVPVDMRVFAD